MDLGNTDCLLLGPFNFELISPANRTRQKVGTDVWLELADICAQRDILQPTVGIHLKFCVDPPTDGKCEKKRKRKTIAERKGGRV